MVTSTVDPCFEYPIYLTFSCCSCLSLVSHLSIHTPNIDRPLLVARLSHRTLFTTKRTEASSSATTTLSLSSFGNIRANSKYCPFFVSAAPPSSNIFNNTRMLKDIVADGIFCPSITSTFRYHLTARPALCADITPQVPHLFGPPVSLDHPPPHPAP